MSIMQNQQQSQQPPAPLPQPEYKFRWVVLGIPLTIAVFFYVIRHIEPSFHFGDIIDNLNVACRTKYTRLACMAVPCLAFLIIVKLFRNKRG